MQKFWNFKLIKNEQGRDEVELRIEGAIVNNDDAWLYELFDIENTSPNEFKEELEQYKGQDITVWIDSYGGDVFAAAGIYNALKEHKGNITVKIDSMAMSAASVIAMAGDKILMSPASIMMIHNPLTMALGEANDMRHTAEILDEVKETIINAYQLKTKRSRNKISKMMDNETFMSAKSAIAEGFADDMLYKEDQNNQNEDVMNFSFNKLCIQNSLKSSVNNLLEFQKRHNIIKDDDNLKQNNEKEKEKLLVELDLT